MAKFCAGCGTALKEGARFCEKCGRPVAVEQAIVLAPMVASKPAERLSADGKWRWDGTQWVARVQVAVKTPAVVGQLSADGRWRWNGREWKDATKAHTQYFSDGSRQMVDDKGKKSGWRMTPAQIWIYSGFLLLAVPVFIFILYKIFTS